MTNLQSLSIFLTERLMLAAQDIYKAVEVTVTEYHDEITRSRQENELLKRKLLEAGIQVYPESQPGPSAQHADTQSVDHLEDVEEEMQVKLEHSSPTKEAELVQRLAPTVAKEPVSPSPCREAESSGEGMFVPPIKETAVTPQAGMPIKEEMSDSKSDLGVGVFTESAMSSSVGLNGVVASGHDDGLENELNRMASMCKDPKLPLTDTVEFGGSNSCTNSMVPNKVVAQRRDGRACGISKASKVGRERKLEARLAHRRAFRKKACLPDGLLLDEEHSLPALFQGSTDSVSEKDVQLYHESAALYPNQPQAHQCVVCGRSFGSRGLLKVHLRVHSGERPYHCPYCNKNFRQSSHLSVHVRIHTGEKPYTCLSCGKRFSDRSACNRHIKAHLENP